MKRIVLLAATVLACGCVTGVEAPAHTEMAVIAGGDFVFGTTEACMLGSPVKCPENAGTVTGISDFSPTVKIALDPFLIDVTEVTNLQYRYCVEVGKCDDPVGYNIINLDDDYFHKGFFDQFPVANVTAAMAEQYCASVGKRLPTEVEWERVAKGKDGQRRYPLAAATMPTQDCSLAVNLKFCKGKAAPEAVGTNADDYVEEPEADRLPGAPERKVFDLAGNVQEFVKDPYKKDLTCASLFEDPECDCFKCQTSECIKNCYTKCEACELNALCFTWCGPSDADPDGSFPPTKGLPRCIQYDPSVALDQDDILPDAGPKRLVRGGEYSLADANNLCRLWATDRSRTYDLDKSHGTVGFRCAADLDPTCQDGQDLDGDGATDLADPDCLQGRREAAGL